MINGFSPRTWLHRYCCGIATIMRYTTQRTYSAQKKSHKTILAIITYITKIARLIDEINFELMHACHLINTPTRTWNNISYCWRMVTLLANKDQERNSTTHLCFCVYCCDELSTVINICTYLSCCLLLTLNIMYRYCSTRKVNIQPVWKIYK